MKKPRSLPGFYVTQKPMGAAVKKFSGVALVGPTEANLKTRFTFRRVKGKERDMIVITS